MAVVHLLVASLILSVIRSVAAVAGGESNVPSAPLYNAAVPGLMMPVIGLGTGSYGSPGESWDNDDAAMATYHFLKSGGRRLDGALTYKGQLGLARGIATSGVARSDIFITSKIPPCGYNETLANFKQVLKDLQTDYVDLFLIHSACGHCRNGDPDPACDGQLDNHTACRLSTWRAMEEIFRSGSAKSIGVSNYVQRHLQEIFDTPGALWPTVVQNELQVYHHDDDLVAFCKAHNITFNTYAPLTTPDYGPIVHHWPLKRGSLDEPAVLAVGKAHGKSSAQVVLRWAWQQNMVVNPRSMNATHIAEVLDIFDFELGVDEMKTLSNIKPPPGSDGRVCGDPYKCK